MSNNIVQLNEEVITGQIKEYIRDSVEETLHELLEKEAEKLTQTARYELMKTIRAIAAAPYHTSGEVTCMSRASRGFF